MRAFIIEDEKKTGQYLKKGLTENGFIVDVVENGEDGLHLATTAEYSFIILDVMLPDRDGWSIITELRRTGKQTPVIFLTARDTIDDRVKGTRTWCRRLSGKALRFFGTIGKDQNRPPPRSRTVPGSSSG